MLHYSYICICIPAVTISLRWARRSPWASCLLFLCFIESPALNANSIYPDQTPPLFASYLFGVFRLIGCTITVEPKLWLKGLARMRPKVVPLSNDFIVTIWALCKRDQ